MFFLYHPFKFCNIVEIRAKTHLFYHTPEGTTTNSVEQMQFASFYFIKSFNVLNI